MSHNDGVADAQTKARATHFRTSRSLLPSFKESIKDVWNSSAGIPQPVPRPQSRFAFDDKMHTDLAAGGSELERIVDQVVDDLAEVLTVAVNRDAGQCGAHN